MFGLTFWLWPQTTLLPSAIVPLHIWSFGIWSLLVWQSFCLAPLNSVSWYIVCLGPPSPFTLLTDHNIQNSPALCLKPFQCAFWSMIWLIVLMEDPLPLTETQLSDTGLHCAPKCFGSLQISWCYAHSQGIRCQKQQSNPTTSMNIHHVWP